MDLLSSSSIPCEGRQDYAPCAAGALSSSHEYISVALDDASLHVFKVDGSHQWVFTDPCGHIVWAHIIVGNMLVAGSLDGTLRAWTISNGRKLHEVPAAGDSVIFEEEAGCVRSSAAVRKLHPLQGGDSILVGTVRGSVHQWDVGADQYHRSFLGGHESLVFDIQSFDNGSRFISAAPKQNTLVAWDVSKAAMLWKNRQDCRVAAFAIGTGVVILGRQDGGVRVLRLEDGVEMLAFQAHSQSILGVLISNDLLVSTDCQGLAKVWLMPQTCAQFVLKRSERLYDHAVTHRRMLGDWLVTAGKNGGGDEDICGLDYQLKIWKLQGDEDSARPPQEVGPPVTRIWGLTTMGNSGKIALSLMKRGMPALEIWGKS